MEWDEPTVNPSLPLGEVTVIEAAGETMEKTASLTSEGSPSKSALYPCSVRENDQKMGANF